MLIYFAGVRDGFLVPIKRKLPRHVLLTFNDLNDKGGREQVRLFKSLVKERKKRIKK